MNMSTENEVVVSEVVATKEVEVKAEKPKAEAKSSGEPDHAWVAERLEREQRKLLKELGVENLDEAKAFMKEIKTRKEADKSHELKAQELATQLASSKEHGEKLASSLKTFASAKMASLSPEQQAAVKAIAKNDPAAQLETIEALAPTWVAPVEAPKEAVVKPPVANTSSSKDMPAGAVTSPTNRKAEYERMKETNPIYAGRFLLQYQSEIYPDGE
jgi:hypothetical protein